MRCNSELTPTAGQRNHLSVVTTQPHFAHSTANSSLYQNLLSPDTYDAVPRAGRVVVGSPWSVSLVTAGTVATVVTFLSTGLNPSFLAWANTGLATLQNVELPLVTHGIGELRQVLRQTLQNNQVAIPPRIVWDGCLTKQDNMVPQLGSMLNSVNDFLDKPSVAIGRALATPLASGAAFGSMAGLWIGFGVATKQQCCDLLLLAVNSIPQYFTTPWVTEALLLTRDINTMVHVLDQKIRAAGSLPASTALAQRTGIRGFFRRITHDVCNVTGTPINALLNLGVAVGLGIGTCVQGLTSTFNGQANAALATIQFPDFMALKSVTMQTRKILDQLLADLNITLPADPPHKQWWTGAGATGQPLRAANAVAHGISRGFGSSEMVVASLVTLAALGTSYGLFDNKAVWLTVFNGIPQCITTVAFESVAADINDMIQKTNCLLQNPQVLACLQSEQTAA